MKPDPAKVRAIENIPTPNDIAAVHPLLDMINYLAPQIPNMASITYPLHDLIKAHVHFQWNASAQKALELIKDTLSTEVVLHYFDPSTVSVIQVENQHDCIMIDFY